MAKSNFIVRGGADFSGLYSGLNTAQKKMSGFQAGMSKTLKGIGVVVGTLAIGKLVKDSITAASGLESAMMGLESIVSGQGKSINKAKTFINDYVSDGLVPLTNAVTAYKNLTARGYNDEQIQTTMNRLKDAASFGRQASYSLGDAVTSATEGLKNENSILVDNAGVTKNVSKMWEDYAKSIGKTSSNLTKQEKIQAEVNGIIQETQWQVGDAAKYTQTFAGRLAGLTKTLTDIKVNLGNAFLPIANIVMPLLQFLANKLEYVTSVFAAFSQALFGKATKVQAKGTQEQATAVGELGDATEKAGKQAKGATAGFDEINSLSLNEGGSGVVDTSVGGVSEVGTVDDGTGGMMEGLSSKATEMATKVKESFTNMKNAIVDNKNIIIPAIGGIVGALAGMAVLSGIASLIDGFTKLTTATSGLWGLLLKHPLLAIVAVIGALIGAFVTAYKTNDEFRAKVDNLWEAIKTNLTPIIEQLKTVLLEAWENVLIPIGHFLSGAFVVAWQVVGNIIKWLWSNVLVPFSSFLLWLWQSVIVPLGNIMIEGLGKSFTIVGEIVKSMWNNIMKPLASFFTTVLKAAIQGLIDIFLYWWHSLESLGNFLSSIFKPVIEGLISVFQFLWNNVMVPFIDFIGGEFMTVFNLKMEKIKVIIDGLKVVFVGLIEFITGIFTNDWGRAWEGVKTVFKGVFDTLYGIAKAPLNLIIKSVNKVIDGLNKIQVKIPDWVSKLTGISGTWGMNIPNIPALATGGITNGPMMALIGDNPGGREVVSPLNDLQDIISSSVVNAVMNAMQFAPNNTQQGDTILQLDGTVFARLMKKYTDNNDSRLGNNLIIQTT